LHHDSSQDLFVVGGVIPENSNSNELASRAGIVKPVFKAGIFNQKKRRSPKGKLGKSPDSIKKKNVNAT
jgi:hypothetical protein